MAVGWAAIRRWYVDAGVSRSGDGRSWETAWKRPADIAWREIAAGDTICFSGGRVSKTYNDRLEIRHSGDLGLPITVTAGTDPGHDGEVVFDFGASNSSLLIRDCANVVVSGFTFRNGMSGSVARLRNLRGGVELRDNIIEIGRTPGNGNARGVDVRECSSAAFGPNIVAGNRITTPENSTAQTDGIYTMENGHGALRFEYNSVFVNNTDNTGHSDCFQSYRDGSMQIVGNVFRGPVAGRNNHPVWIEEIQDGGLFEITGNRCVNRNGGFNLSVWQDGRSTASGTAVLVGNEIIGGRRALYFARNPAISVIGNTIVPDHDGFAYFISVDPLVPSNVDNNRIVTSGPVASLLEREKSWSAWQRDGYDRNGQRTERLAASPGEDFG